MTNRQRESERALIQRLLNEFFEFLKASEIIVLALLVAMAGGVWWTIRGDSASATASSNGPRPRPEPAAVAAADPIATTGPTVDEPQFHRLGLTAVSHSQPGIDFSQTSWENPFTADHWDSTGWSFDGQMMQSRGDQPAAALFARTYRKLRLDLHLASVGDPGTFEVRLRVPTAGADMTVTFSSGAVIVSADCPQQKGVIKRKDVALEMTAEKPGHLSLMATGNRVRIFWNDHPLLACTQPASLSGRDLTFALVSHGAGFRISKLRIEGE